MFNLIIDEYTYSVESRSLLLLRILISKIYMQTCLSASSQGLSPYQIGKLWWNELWKFSISTPIMWKIKFCFIIRNLNICCISFCQVHITISIVSTYYIITIQRIQFSIIIGSVLLVRSVAKKLCSLVTVCDNPPTTCKSK